MAFAVYEIGDKGGLYEPYNQVNQMHAEQNNYGDAITCDDGPKKKVVLVN